MSDRDRISTTLTDFSYVDTAIYGVRNRNRVMLLDQFRPSPNASDVFVTYFRFTRELADHAATNPLVAPDKRPSVKGYRGPAFASIFPVDFDDADNPGLPRTETIRAVRKLQAQHEVPPTAVRISFSGRKGFSLEIPSAPFGGFTPSADLAIRFKRLAATLFPECRTLDTSIYEMLRLWRCPNSRHGTSGLFKTRLTLGELETLDMDAIRTLAVSPRPFPPDPPDDDWDAAPGLVDAWRSTTAPEPEAPYEPAKEGSRPLSAKEQKALVAVIGRRWHDGQRHAIALGLAGWLALAGVPEAEAKSLIDTLSTGDDQQEDRLCCLRDTYQRRRLGLPVAGPSRLRAVLTSQQMQAVEHTLNIGRPVRLLPSVRGRRPIVELAPVEVGHAR